MALSSKQRKKDKNERLDLCVKGSPCLPNENVSRCFKFYAAQLIVELMTSSYLCGRLALLNCVNEGRSVDKGIGLSGDGDADMMHVDE